MNGTQFEYKDICNSISWFARNCITEEDLMDVAMKADEEDRLAAALLLCTCDSNERKAEG